MVWIFKRWENQPLRSFKVLKYSFLRKGKTQRFWFREHAPEATNTATPGIVRYCRALCQLLENKSFYQTKAVWVGASAPQSVTLGTLNLLCEQGLPDVLWFMYICEVSPDPEKGRDWSRRPSHFKCFETVPTSLCQFLSVRKWNHHRFFPEALSFPQWPTEGWLLESPLIPVSVKSSMQSYLSFKVCPVNCCFICPVLYHLKIYWTSTMI